MIGFPPFSVSLRSVRGFPAIAPVLLVVAALTVFAACSAADSELPDGGTPGPENGAPSGTNNGDRKTNTEDPTGAKVESVVESAQTVSSASSPDDVRSSRAEPPVVEELKVEILAEFPHDPQAFTQGLVFDGGVFYESTGLYGRSSVREVDAASGRVIRQRMLDPSLFGEGLALVGDRLIGLTWHAGVAQVFELSALEIVDRFDYRGEGWGLAYDGERLIMSDGSDTLTFRDPRTFQVLSTRKVLEGRRPVAKLNELEFAEGQIYANVWSTDRIVRIDPQSGQVTARIDASGLLPPDVQRQVDVLNGIAYDPVSKTFWITGKFWPKMFQVRFVPA